MIAARKALLTTALEALGPERVTRGLTATGHKWSDCFLAIATDGEANLLRQELKTNLLRWELQNNARAEREPLHGRASRRPIQPAWLMARR